MAFIKKFWRESLVGALLLLNLVVWSAVTASGVGDLRVYFLDVGQGDAILVDSPTHGRVLVDGGRNRQVLSELGRVLPFGDRRIDVVIETHPDADHIGGLPEIVSRYDVGIFLEPGVESSNKIDDELRVRLAERGVEALLARRGMVVNFGDGAQLEILYPHQDVSHLDPNDASVVARVVYGESELLLTGDATLKVEHVLLGFDHATLVSDVLKAGHHGSKTSSSPAFVSAVSPEYAIISAGKNNRYGHPHQEVLNVLKNAGAQVVSTAEVGTIVFVSNGTELYLK